MQGYEVANRPNAVLRTMPRSCNVAYDVIVSLADCEGRWRGTISQICTTAHISRQTAQRAINRIVAAHLIDITDRGVGRGHGHTYQVRVFTTNPKRRKSVSERVYVSYPQKSVTSTPQKEHVVTGLGCKRSLSRMPLQTRPSRGQIIAAVRRVAEANGSLSDRHRQAITNTFGRMLYKLGQHATLTANPPALDEILCLLGRPKPPGCPPPAAAARHVYAWCRDLINSIVEKHRLGIPALLTEIHPAKPAQKLSPEKCNIPPQRRVIAQYKPRVRQTWSQRGVTPSWAMSA